MRQRRRANDRLVPGRQSLLATADLSAIAAKATADLSAIAAKATAEALRRHTAA